MEKIRKKLEDEIAAQLETLPYKDGEDYTQRIDDVAKLTDRYVELSKIEEKSKIDVIWEKSVQIAQIVLPILTTVWGTRKCLKFEESGTVTTLIGRGFINKLIPKK